MTLQYYLSNFAKNIRLGNDINDRWAFVIIKVYLTLMTKGSLCVYMSSVLCDQYQ